MLQNHMDKFALYDNTIITNNNIPTGTYNFEFAVNNYDNIYNLELIVEDEPDVITINLPPVCTESLYRVTIKDDINIGTTITTFNCSDPEGNKLTYSVLTMDVMLRDIINITSSGRVYIINTPSTRKAIMGKYIVMIEVSDGEYKNAFNLLVTINDDCYDAPCGNNPCLDMFNSYVCKCRGGFVGANCDPDYIDSVQAVSAEQDTLSNATMAGIVLGTIILMMIIIILLVVVFRKNDNKTNDIQSNTPNSKTTMITNPVFINPNNTMYDYNNTSNTSYTNPMYDYNNNLQKDGDFVVRDNKATPSWHQLSVRHNNTIYNDMIRTHLNNTYELVAQSRNIGRQPTHNNMDDLVKYYSVDRGIGYTLNCTVLNNPMYMYSNATHPQYDVPALPLKVNQKDMIRSLADENTNELYGNI
jgi:hypothetical protein